MKDQYNREIDYIRISVTDRCNLRCKYCMPECGVESVSHDSILTFDEITTVVKACSKLGIKHVKVTGGEPLVRRGITSLVKQLKAVDGIETVTLTTNGILLKQMLPGLVEAGIDGINISLDTLDREKYKEITGADRLQEVLEAIEVCEEYCNSQEFNKKLNLAAENKYSSDEANLNCGTAGFKLKINTVTLAHCNEDEIIAFASLAKSSKIDIRFIEMMPVGMGKEFNGYDQQHIMDKLEAEFGSLVPIPEAEKHGNGPAVYYRPKDFIGTIGFISAVSHRFCDHCNRVRLTAEGVLKPCLQYSTGIDLRAILREERDIDSSFDCTYSTACTDSASFVGSEGNRGIDSNKEGKLTEAIKKGIFEKPKSHQFSSATIKDREEKLMSKIGG